MTSYYSQVHNAYQPNSGEWKAWQQNTLAGMIF